MRQKRRDASRQYLRSADNRRLGSEAGERGCEPKLLRGLPRRKVCGISFPAQDSMRAGANLCSNVIARLDLAVQISRGVIHMATDKYIGKPRSSTSPVESQPAYTTRDDGSGIESVQQECPREVESKTAKQQSRKREYGRTALLSSCSEPLIYACFKSNLFLGLPPVRESPRGIGLRRVSSTPPQLRYQKRGYPHHPKRQQGFLVQQ